MRESCAQAGAATAARLSPMPAAAERRLMRAACMRGDAVAWCVMGVSGPSNVERLACGGAAPWTTGDPFPGLMRASLLQRVEEEPGEASRLRCPAISAPDLIWWVICGDFWPGFAPNRPQIAQQMRRPHIMAL
ncbi:hypothetical protein GCM10009672_07590 [Nesterenkonia lutea]